MSTLTPNLSGPNMGLCPECGSIQAKDYVQGWYGWICGSYSTSHEGQPISFQQSLDCVSMRWRIRAEKAERERDEARNDVVLAAGELRVTMPEPGTVMARIMVANSIMRRERDEAREQIRLQSDSILRHMEVTAEMQNRALEAESKLTEQAAQIAQLREALGANKENTIELMSERDWWKDEPRCGYQVRYEQMKKERQMAESALSSPPPPVVPLEDVRPLVEAAKTLKAAKGRYNTGIAYERFLEAISTFATKHPLP